MDKKKLIYILSAVMGVMILFVVIIALVSSCSNKTLTYDKIENTLKSAANSYFEDNTTLLPNEEGVSVTVDSNTLVNGGYMKALSELVEEGTSCSAKVIVTKNGHNYLYSPILNCGDKYQTTKLIDVIMKDNQITTTGAGLYKIDNLYVFKGEYINNYVQLDSNLWRIIDIDADGYARLIYVGKNTEDTYVWDDRYNIDKDDNVGVNDYSVSRIKDTLVALDNNNQYVTEETKKNLAYRTWCVGKRSSENKAINNAEECSTTVTGQLFGLPYVTDYVNASIDSNCNSIEDLSCGNYNYLLASSLTSWTLTGSKEKSYKVYVVNRNGYSQTDASNDKAIRPTVYLSNNSIYLEGDGSQGNPYKIK